LSRMRGNSHVRFLEGKAPVRGLTYSTVKVEQWQIRKVVKNVWRLTPAHNALTYLAYQCDYTKLGRVSSVSRVGRFYTVTKEFIDSLGL